MIQAPIGTLRGRGGAAFALVALLLCGAGCSPRTEDPWPEQIAPSPQLERPLREAWQRVGNPSGGDSVVVSDLLLYDEIRQQLHDGSPRRDVSRRFHAIWSADPTNVLWIELAARESRRFDREVPVFDTLDTPALSDTLTALGAYVQAWTDRTWAKLPTHFDIALERPGELDPFARFWIAFRAAYGRRVARDFDRCVERCVDLLSQAHTMGGPRLESHVWHEIARAEMLDGDLDDALLAASIADTLRVLADGPPLGLLKIREQRARILADRRDARAAFALYESNVDLAAGSGLTLHASNNLNRAGMLAEAMGDLERAIAYDQRALGLAISDADSLNVPPHLMNIARSYRLLGELDSCLAYQTRAEAWVAAFPHPDLVRRMPLMQAEYYSQIGAHDVVDSLLAVASRLSRDEDPLELRAEFQIRLIEGWMQTGRPDLVYRAIEDNADLREGIRDSYADRHVVADFNLLIGEFLTRRGEYVRAKEALDRAAAALATRPNPSKQWMLARNQGRLDRARGNLEGAEVHFLECVRIGQDLGYPHLSAEGRLLTGMIRIDRGDFEGAREAFPREELETSFATRILASLLTGVSWLREGRPARALKSLEQAHAECRSWTPLDLVGRIELETGRAHAAMDDPATAQQFYERVARRIHSVDFRVGSTEHLEYFHGDLRRDLVEAYLALEPVDPGRSLRFAAELLPRWRPIDAPLSSPQLVFFVGEESSSRWLVAGDRVSWKRLPGVTALEPRLAIVLADLGTPGRTVSASDLAALSSMLLADVEDAWAPDQTLRIVPDLGLFGVPWAALRLPESGRDVVDHGPVVILDRPIAGAGSAAGTGDRLLAIAAGGEALGLNRLRHAEDEARDVGGTWPAGKTDLRIGPEAAQLLSPGTDLTAYRAIHVASHALVYSGRDDRTTLVLGDGATASAADVRRLSITADLVFLSACEAGDGGELRSAHAGLARSFQDAGARQVIAPIAVIDDDAARNLAVHFYRHWTAPMPAAEALRAAQLEQRDGRWSHPFYWAFYEVFGAPDRD